MFNADFFPTPLSVIEQLRRVMTVSELQKLTFQLDRILSELLTSKKMKQLFAFSSFLTLCAIWPLVGLVVGFVVAFVVMLSNQKRERIY